MHSRQNDWIVYSSVVVVLGSDASRATSHHRPAPATLCCRFFRNLRCYEEVFVISSEMPAKARRSAIARAVVGGLLGKGAVVITTYGMVAANPKQFAPQGSGRKWDYVILDEGHKIKNSSTRWVPAVRGLSEARTLFFVFAFLVVFLFFRVFLWG